jgi:hypothetical protein
MVFVIQFAFDVKFVDVTAMNFKLLNSIFKDSMYPTLIHFHEEAGTVDVDLSDSVGNMVRIRFPSSVAYQKRDEIDTVSEEKEWIGVSSGGLYLVENGGYLEYLRKSSAFSRNDVKQYTIITSEESVDVIAYGDPIIEDVQPR